MKQYLLILLVVIFSLISSSTPILALTQDQWNSIYTNSEWYSPNNSACNNLGISLLTASQSSGLSTWNSNTLPPYYVESFAINTLEDIAGKLGVPTTSTVTQQHVLALVAWAYEEGGNISNTFTFNLWNTGLTSRPDLLATSANNSGLQSFGSFNDGVEAAAITMTQPSENRIGSILANPTSTASQVLNAVANYSSYTGNKIWASDPNYLQKLMAVLAQTENNYPSTASIIIGPGQENNGHVPQSELKFAYGPLAKNQGNIPTSSNNVNIGCLASSNNCQSGGTGNAAILCEAQKYNGIYYNFGGGHQSYSVFRQNCPEQAISSAAASSTPQDPGPCSTDCSGLVSVSIDGAFNQNFSMTVTESTGQMIGSGSQYWQPISLSQVQPGDIATIPGHVEIVDHYDPSTNTLYTFGSHETGKQTSLISTVNYFKIFYTWTGPTN